MPRHDHLRLVRLPEQLERRKRPGGGGAPARDPSHHSGRLEAELTAAVEEQQRRRQPEFVDPSLILRVRMNGMTLEEDWERLGLTVLATDDDKTLVLFASENDLRGFRERLAAYARGVPDGQASPAYSGFINRVEEIAAVTPLDRIGVRLREEGFSEPADFADAREFVLDLELWDFGRREARTRKLDQIADYIERREGEVLDRYVGPSITMLRLRADGAVVRTLLDVEEVAALDLPPEPDVAIGEALNLTLEELPALAPLPDDAPIIGVIDSGVNDHPLLADAIVGAIGAPASLGTADEWGHGTRVSGVALFGDLRAQLEAGQLARTARLAVAKVVNDRGGFDDRRLVPTQMRDAITGLHGRFGCRIFVVALGDPKRPYDDGKVGPWARTLDELARELDVLIIVSAGNRAPRGGNRIEQAVTDYPGYLTEPANRICEPAGAMNVLTVGALAHGEGLGPEFADDVHVRPITRALEPAPFSRVGQGSGAPRSRTWWMSAEETRRDFEARRRPTNRFPMTGQAYGTGGRVLRRGHTYPDVRMLIDGEWRRRGGADSEIPAGPGDQGAGPAAARPQACDPRAHRPGGPGGGFAGHPATEGSIHDIDGDADEVAPLEVAQRLAQRTKTRSLIRFQAVPGPTLRGAALATGGHRVNPQSLQGEPHQ